MSLLRALGLALLIGFLPGALLALDLARLNGITGRFPDVIILVLYFGILAGVVAAAGGLLLGTMSHLVLRRRHSFTVLVAGGGLAAVIWLDRISASYGAHQFLDPRNANLSYPFGKSLAMAAGILVLCLVLCQIAALSLSRLPQRLLSISAKAILIVLGVAILGQSFFGGGDEAVVPSPYVRGQAQKLVVILEDGATWDLIDPLMEQGRLPRLRSFIESGSRATLGTDHPTASPRLWTIASTGHTPAESGITDFLLVKLAGVGPPIREYRWYGPTTMFWSRMILLYTARTPMAQLVGLSSSQRRVPAIWNIADRVGLSSVVLNWWGTKPPEPLEYGVMIAGEASGPQEYWPDSLATELAVDQLDIDEAEIEALMGELPSDSQLTPEKRETLEAAKDELRRLARDDLEWFALAEELLDRGQPDLLLLGLRGIDGISHVFYMEHALREATGSPDLSSYERRFTSPEEIAVFGPVIERCYELQDRHIGRILDRLEENTVVLLLSDHGHLYDGGNHLATSPPGIVVLSGATPRESLSDQPDLYDICPTMLEILDLPLARDMIGESLAVPHRPGENPALALRSEGAAGLIDSYGRTAGGLVGADMDAEAVEALKALGYIR